MTRNISFCSEFGAGGACLIDLCLKLMGSDPGKGKIYDGGWIEYGANEEPHHEKGSINLSSD